MNSDILENSESSIKSWHEHRAFQLAPILCAFGLVITIVSMILDIHWGTSFTIIALFLNWIGLGICVRHFLSLEQKMPRQGSAAETSKTEFLANISHELRTPLSAIMGYTDLLMAGETSEKDRDRFTQTIHRNSRQLANLVDDLLDLSKVESGRLEIRKENVVLSELIQDVVDSVQNLALRKSLDLSVRYRTVVPRAIEADPTRLRQVLCNLLGNALKFTDRGYVRLIVESTFDRNEPCVLFFVEDSGCGILDEKKNSVFQVFTQADASLSRRYGGTGLGLNLSQKMVRLMGGDLRLEHSEPGIGSLFTFHIPIGRVIQQSWQTTYQPDVRKTTSKTQTGQVLAGRKILVVDDIVENQRLFRMYLEASGAKVDVASDGQEGVQKALSDKWDAILMDIQMPMLNGYDAVSALRKKGYSGPIFALTAHAMKEDKERCFAVGCDGHLAKPIQRFRLIETIESAVAKSVSRAAIRTNLHPVIASTVT